jgi:hypothetical protein
LPRLTEGDLGPLNGGAHVVEDHAGLVTQLTRKRLAERRIDDDRVVEAIGPDGRARDDVCLS